MGTKLNAVIGLEVHVQLWSRSKLFSSARTVNSEHAASNSCVQLLDMATPGVLPTLNKECVKLAIRTASVLNSTLAEECRFDRKHYFYPDMPSGYQITQHELPIARGGFLRYYLREGCPGPSEPGSSATARIKQIQLEMDSGKLVHGQQLDLVDLNRAGVPLVEIVTEPCFSHPAQAATFVENLRWHLIHHRISACEMHHGHLRVDANVSVARPGEVGVRTEVKNINSFRDIESALTFEVRRQRELLQKGGRVVEETRGVVDGVTVPQRSKGDELDYRFLPEPNLPRLRLRAEWSKSSADLLPPAFEVYISRHGFSVDYAFSLMYDEPLKAFVDQVLLRTAVPPAQLEPTLRELSRIAHETGIEFPPHGDGPVDAYSQLLDLFHCKSISRLVFIDLVKFYSVEIGSFDVGKKLTEDDLWAVTDAEEVDKVVGGHLQQLPAKAVNGARANGQSKQFRKLRNDVIRLSRKRIPVEDVERSLGRLLWPDK